MLPTEYLHLHPCKTNAPPSAVYPWHSSSSPQTESATSSPVLFVVLSATSTARPSRSRHPSLTAMASNCKRWKYCSEGSAHHTLARRSKARIKKSMARTAMAVVEPMEKAQWLRRHERYGVDGGELKNTRGRYFRLRRPLMGRCG